MSWPDSTREAGTGRRPVRLLHPRTEISEMSALDSELAALPTLSAEELRLKWRNLRCGEPMALASRDLMIREIAYKMQERAHGGLPPAIRRRLRALAGELEANGAGVLAPAPLLKPGTRLLREWGGK